MPARSLTLDQVWDLVGRPSRPGALYFRLYEAASIYAWEDEFCGRAGWSWAIARDGIIVGHGWSAGNRVDRDGDITGAIARLAHVIGKRASA